MDESKHAAGSPPGSEEAIEALLDRLAQKTAALVLQRLEKRLLLRPKLLDYTEAAKYLGFYSADAKVPESPLRQRKKQFPDDCFIEIGNALRWDVEALDKWIDAEKARQSAARKRPHLPSAEVRKR